MKPYIAQILPRGSCSTRWRSGTGRERVERAQHVRVAEAVVAKLTMAAFAYTSLLPPWVCETTMKPWVTPSQVLQRMVAQPGNGRGRVQRAQHVRAVEAVVARLLMAACADTSLSVRRTVLESMQAASPLDAYLAQADWCAHPG